MDRPTSSPSTQRIIEFLGPASEGVTVADVRIGLRYTSVYLDDGNLGIAWTAREGSGCCADGPEGGTLGGRSAAELLEMLAEPHRPLYRTLGLATANALAARMPRLNTTTVEILDLVGVRASDRVVMAGFFAPLIPRLRATGCHLDILELRDDKPGTVSPEDGRSSLASCTVAILTATSVVTGTLDELLADLGNPRAVVILGPSSFMRPEVFVGTPVTHIAGVRVRDALGVERVVSEGGGTKSLKRYVDFETLCME